MIRKNNVIFEPGVPMVSGKKERGYLPSNIMPGLRIPILVRKKNEKKPMISKQTARIERRLARKRIIAGREELRGFTAYQETQGAECGNEYGTIRHLRK